MAGATRQGNRGGGDPPKPWNDAAVVLLREPKDGSTPMTFPEIAGKLGFTRQRASYIYHRAKRAAP